MESNSTSSCFIVDDGDGDDDDDDGDDDDDDDLKAFEIQRRWEPDA